MARPLRPLLIQKRTWFGRFARRTSYYAGKPVAFALAVLVLIVWAAAGPFFHYSDTWQLIINTSTTIITFLMVFVIQHSQNRDSEALQIKLDELIHKFDATDNSLLDLEELEVEELEQIRERYLQAAREARTSVRKLRARHHAPHQGGQ